MSIFAIVKSIDTKYSSEFKYRDTVSWTKFVVTSVTLLLHLLQPILHDDCSQSQPTDACLQSITAN